MTDGQRDRDPRRAFGEGANAGWTALSLLIGGMAVWGGIGWLIDTLAGTKFALPIGVVLGAAGGIILIFRRYSSFDKADPPPDEKPGSGPHTE